jgi:Uma2 family endonuclease
MEQAAPTSRRYTVDEYFQMSSESGARLEFRDGEVVSMAGGSANHSRIILNVGAALLTRLANTPCEAFESSLNVRLARKTLYSHPDITVVCGGVELDPDNRFGQTVVNARVIFEVLSPSTERYDRTRKFAFYRRMKSLQQYVLVSQDEPLVETYHVNSDGSWAIGPTAFAVRDTISLSSINVDLPLAEIYARVEFPPPSPRPPVHDADDSEAD